MQIFYFDDYKIKMENCQKVWVLNIIFDIDDYKRLNEIPESKIYLTKNRSDAVNILVNKLHERMGDLYGSDVSLIDKKLLPYLDIVDDEFDSYNIKEKFQNDENAS
jgi:hypothetical protein